MSYRVSAEQLSWAMELRTESEGGHFQDVPAAPARLLPSLGSYLSQGLDLGSVLLQREHLTQPGTSSGRRCVCGGLGIPSGLKHNE